MDVDTITEVASYAGVRDTVRTTCAVWDSAKTPAKAHRRVDGGTETSSSTSCRPMSRSLVSAIDGTHRPLRLRSGSESPTWTSESSQPSTFSQPNSKPFADGAGTTTEAVTTSRMSSLWSTDVQNFSEKWPKHPMMFERTLPLRRVGCWVRGPLSMRCQATCCQTRRVKTGSRYWLNASGHSRNQHPDLAAIREQQSGRYFRKRGYRRRYFRFRVEPKIAWTGRPRKVELSCGLFSLRPNLRQPWPLEKSRPASVSATAR